jgi:lipid A 4'-phosphatase
MKYCIFIFSAILIIIAINPQIDILFSQYFYSESNSEFYFRDSKLLKTYSFIINSAISILFGLAFSRVCLDYLLCKYTTKIKLFSVADRVLKKIYPVAKKANLIIFLTIVISPILLVNTIGKPLWDRARPYEINEFSGDKQFTEYYKPFAGQESDAFPSGHTSRAFAFISIIFAFSTMSARRKAFFITLALGLGAGLTRIAQGNHYISDVSASALLTLATIVILSKLINDKAERNKS